MKTSAKVSTKWPIRVREIQFSDDNSDNSERIIIGHCVENSVYTIIYSDDKKCSKIIEYGVHSELSSNYIHICTNTNSKTANSYVILLDVVYVFVYIM